MNYPNKMQQDGGYYALKGYLYQFNKTIKQILESDDENKLIGFERDQDIDDEDNIIQVKYKEKSNYSDSSILPPLIQLIEHYKIDSSKNFFLECHFQNKSNQKESFDLNKLNQILGVKSSEFDYNLKSGFISKFTLIFSDDFNTFFNVIIEKIKSVFKCKNGEEVAYHAIISNHLLCKVVNNNSENIAQRQCSITELKKVINASKSSIFFSAHRDLLGKDQYFSMIKKEYFSFRNIDDWERFFIIEIEGNESISDLKSCVLKIKEKFYVQAKKTIKSGAPYILFNGINSKKLAKLKTELLSEKHLLRDGFDFQGAKFNAGTIQEVSSVDNKISLKFLNKESYFTQVISRDLGKTKEIYQFFINKPFFVKKDLKNCKIQVNNIGDISLILN